MQSCEGGEGHTYELPTVEFDGVYGDGMRALGIALIHGFPVKRLSRTWCVIENEATGPVWELVLSRPVYDDA